MNQSENIALAGGGSQWPKQDRLCQRQAVTIAYRWAEHHNDWALRPFYGGSIQQAITANGARQIKEEAMRRVAVATVLLSGLCMLLPMPESIAQQVGGNQVEPKAGSWKTWVITSGREFRVAPPPN